MVVLGISRSIGLRLRQDRLRDALTALRRAPGALRTFHTAPGSRRPGSLPIDVSKLPNKTEISDKTIYRLSVYYRCLVGLDKEGATTVSSEALSQLAGVKPTQLRKDLTHFGQFGTRGLGYDVRGLLTMLGDLIGASGELQPVALIGVGNLGTALLSYGGFASEGFRIVAAFDQDPDRPRDARIRVPIHPMDDLAGIVENEGIHIAILTVPTTAAQGVAEHLIGLGITGILNFAPTVLSAPPTVRVRNVNLAIELENLGYFTRQRQPENGHPSIHSA